jgi:hypothetical protein
MESCALVLSGPFIQEAAASRLMGSVRDKEARSSQRLCLLKAETEDVTPTREVHGSELFKIKACGNFSARVLYGSLDLIFRKHLLPFLGKSVRKITIFHLPFFRPFSLDSFISVCLFPFLSIKSVLCVNWGKIISSV